MTNALHVLKNEEHVVAIGADILPTLVKFVQSWNILPATTHSVSVRSPVDVKWTQLKNINWTEVALE